MRVIALLLLGIVNVQILFLSFLKIVIHELAQFEGEAFEVHGDVEDASQMKLSPIISVTVVRGWYELLAIVSLPSPPPVMTFGLTSVRISLPVAGCSMKSRASKAVPLLWRRVPQTT